MADPDLSYWLDRNNRVARIAGAWDAFARENGAPELAGDTVLGRDIGRFVADEATRMFVYTTVDFVRTTGRVVRRTYRCDSPECRRAFEMSVLPERDRTVRFDHRLVTLERRPAPVRVRVATGALVKRCSLCCRVLADGTWLEIDEFVASRGGDLGWSDVTVYYGVCPACRGARTGSNSPVSR